MQNWHHPVGLIFFVVSGYWLVFSTHPLICRNMTGRLAHGDTFILQIHWRIYNCYLIASLITTINALGPRELKWPTVLTMDAHLHQRPVLYFFVFEKIWSKILPDLASGQGILPSHLWTILYKRPCRLDTIVMKSSVHIHSTKAATGSGSVIHGGRRSSWM